MIPVSEYLAGVNCRMDSRDKLVPQIKRMVKEGKAILVCLEVLGSMPMPRESNELRNGRVYSQDHPHSGWLVQAL